MYSYSPNMLKTFADCPYKYYLKYIRKISIPQPASYFEKGKKIHALANYYLRGDDISKIIKGLNEEEMTVWNMLFNNEFFQMSYVKSEYNLSCKIGEFWIGGRLDALMRNGEDYYILDYKTGSIPKNPQQDFQTMVYLICADRKLKQYNSLRFVYIDLKNNHNEVIELTPETRKDYEKTLEEVCKYISYTEEYPQKTERCRFCEYLKMCNF